MNNRLIELKSTALIALFSLLSGCSDDSRPMTPEEPAPVSPDQPVISGLDVYQDHCASCHDAGLDGAPVTGKRSDWENRSGLWVAVLAEHVKAGYLQMPARGGVSPLSDLSVTQAVEHMMLQTFPEKPAD